jgi:hypothetical protein
MGDLMAVHPVWPEVTRCTFFWAPLPILPGSIFKRFARQLLILKK